LEFGYLSDFYVIPGAAAFDQPEKFRDKVDEDVKKIGDYLNKGICRIGYVIVFEDRDSEFPSMFVADAEKHHGCRVRFIRGS
jgi:hypothetical protein